jgi:fructokinase
MRIGVDVGGTKIEAIALDAEGVELRRIRVATPRGDYDGTVATIAGLVGSLERETGQTGTVGVGIPGTIVAATGLVKNANSTWLNGRPLQRDLSVALRREVRCANDANCFAVSEATDGAARDFNVVFGVIFGTGCGGGIAINGRVHVGPNGLGGEWGHVPLPWPTLEEIPGTLCYCGRHGCLEGWISGTGFEWDFARVTSRNLRGSEIVAAADAGDRDASEAVDRLLERMARGLSVIVNVLDPDAIVIGGGLSNMRRLYEGDLGSRLRDYGFGGGVETPILRNRHGDSSGVRGAAWLWPLQRRDVDELARIS